jgi:hypothetical protein
MNEVELKQHNTSLICFKAKPLFFAISSSNLAVESLSLPGHAIKRIHSMQANTQLSTSALQRVAARGAARSAGVS